MSRPALDIPGADIRLHRDSSGLRGAALRWIGTAMLIGVPALIAVTIGWSRSRPAVNDLGLRPETPSRLPDFSFTNQHGQVVTRKDLHDRVCLVTFAFTSCGTTCRQVARNLSRASQRFAGESNVCLVTWTIDPRTDTPPVLSRFSLTAGATNPNWMFLTGSSGHIAEFIQDAFPSATVPASFGNRLPDMSRVFVVDQAGQLRGSADGLMTNLLTVLERAVSTLRSESRPSQF